MNPNATIAMILATLPESVRIWEVAMVVLAPARPVDFVMNLDILLDPVRRIVEVVTDAVSLVTSAVNAPLLSNHEDPIQI